MVDSRSYVHNAVGESASANAVNNSLPLGVRDGPIRSLCIANFLRSPAITHLDCLRVHRRSGLRFYSSPQECPRRTSFCARDRLDRVQRPGSSWFAMLELLTRVIMVGGIALVGFSENFRDMMSSLLGRYSVPALVLMLGASAILILILIPGSDPFLDGAGLIGVFSGLFLRYVIFT